jgi:hypothetical protein
MAPTKILAALCASTFLLISALALIAAPVVPAVAKTGTSPADSEFDNLTVLHIGGGVLASQLVDDLAGMGAEVINSTDIPEAVELNPEVVIIFGGEWFEQRMCDTKLHDFLRLASSAGANLVMVGGTTSKFFEALDSAGVCEIPVTEAGEVRNPAYDNPPMVGLGTKTVDGYTAPSLLFSYTTSPDILEESVTGWHRSLAA